jgi:hypothetical protein
MSCNARSRATRGQIKAFVVVAVRSAMTSLRTAAEVTRANFALIALLPMTALLPAQTASCVAINDWASQIEIERREAGSAACASQARPSAFESFNKRGQINQSRIQGKIQYWD